MTITDQEIIQLWKNHQKDRGLSDWQAPANLKVIDEPSKMLFRLVTEESHQRIKYSQEQGWHSTSKDMHSILVAIGTVRVSSIIDPEIQKQAHQRLLNQIPREEQGVINQVEYKSSPTPYDLDNLPDEVFSKRGFELELVTEEPPAPDNEALFWEQAKASLDLDKETVTPEPTISIDEMITGMEILLKKLDTEVDFESQTQVELDEIREAYLGKTGHLTNLLRKVRLLSPKQRPKFGQLINIARDEVTKRTTKTTNDTQDSLLIS